MFLKADETTEAGVLPSEEIIAAMTKYNEELVKAGVMLAGEGLAPSSRGARVKFEGGKKTVTDGPFTESKELVAGFWMLQCKSLDEAIEWVKRSPLDGGAEVEIRQIFEAEDLGEGFTPELQAKEAELRRIVESRKN
ncbi:MAG: YciI family protein [Actinobacteria bacterium]|nr:MAG: YciI family protein [Actinomycetota bacterium]